MVILKRVQKIRFVKGRHESNIRTILCGGHIKIQVAFTHDVWSRQHTTNVCTAAHGILCAGFRPEIKPRRATFAGALRSIHRRVRVLRVLVLS